MATPGEVMQDLQIVSGDILTTVVLLLHLCECIHFDDKCMYLHSQIVLILVLLGAQKSNMERSKRGCVAVGKGILSRGS